MVNLNDTGLWLGQGLWEGDICLFVNRPECALMCVCVCDIPPVSETAILVNLRIYLFQVHLQQNLQLTYWKLISEDVT